MARIVGMIATSHTPTIGFAHDGNKQEDPVWKPIFDAYAPICAWAFSPYWRASLANEFD